MVLWSRASRRVPSGVAGRVNEAVLEKPHRQHGPPRGGINGVPSRPTRRTGVIVATPTGSTAYSFSARRADRVTAARCLLVTPVSPHMLFDRTLVLDRPRTSVHGRPAAWRVLTVDGREVGDLDRGDIGRCTVALSRRGSSRSAARLPPDPEGQVRPRRPVGRTCWSSCGSTNLGIIEEVTFVLGPGLTAITGETGAGKTLLVGALELLLGGRPTRACARGASEARIDGRFDGSDGEGDRAPRVVLRSTGRSRAYVDGRLATAAELATLGAESGRPARPARPPGTARARSHRAGLDVFAGAWTRTLVVTGCAWQQDARIDERARRALGGDERVRAREIDLCGSRSPRSTRRLEDPARTTPCDEEESLLADAVADREALARRVRSARGRRSRRGGLPRPARSTVVRRSRRARRAPPRCPGRAADIEPGAPTRGRAGRDDPARVETVRARRHQLHELGRKYGPTLADVIAYGAERAAATRRARELRGASCRVSTPVRARTRDGGPRGGDGARPPPAAPQRPAGPGDQVHRPRTGHARTRLMEVRVDAGEEQDDGHDRVTYLLAANAGASARPLARAVSPAASSPVPMLAVRVVLVGGTGHPGVRRGRRRDRRGSRGRGRRLLRTLGSGATRCSVSRTSRRWRRSPVPRSWWRRPWNGGGSWTGAGQSARWRRRRWSTVTEHVAQALPDARGHRRFVPRPPAHGRAARSRRPPEVDAANGAPPPAEAGRHPSRFRAPGEGVDRRTKDMIPRLQAGDIAVINHRDLDRVAADGLIEAGVVAVVNCAPSISGRYPNGGPRPRRRRGDRVARRRGRGVHGSRQRRRRRAHRGGRALAQR